MIRIEIDFVIDQLRTVVHEAADWSNAAEIARPHVFAQPGGIPALEARFYDAEAFSADPLHCSPFRRVTVSG